MSTPEQQYTALKAIRDQLAGRKNVRVLVIEDDPEDAELICASLRRNSITPIVAKNGEEGVRMTAEDGFFVIFLDWKLIGMSGLETLKAIKYGSSDHKVIVLTGAFKPDELLTVALQHGAVCVMAKPLTQQQIELIFGSP